MAHAMAARRVSLDRMAQASGNMHGITNHDHAIRHFA